MSRGFARFWSCAANTLSQRRRSAIHLATTIFAITRRQSGRRWSAREHCRGVPPQVPTKFPQHTFTKKIGITFARFRNLDNCFSHSFSKIALLVKLKRFACHFERGVHGPL